ncbi:hypothetical protein SETIT_9G490400v2 [Setaria italica]|uniref:K-box domain-containing protein n=1 Tax=Setaria italica TaxID=4555 RepID=A0A368SU01_SETIT|nr:hypothetical protein SETIT_9G490400v2 [Setaria italica]
MYKTLERYRSSNYGSQEIKTPLDGEINYQDYLKLKTRVEFLQTTQRNILGEDLGPLSMKELEQLENQIEISLKHIRTRKEQELQDLNKDLRKKGFLQHPDNDPSLQIGYHQQAYMDQLNNEDMGDPNEHGGSGWI